MTTTVLSIRVRQLETERNACTKQELQQKEGNFIRSSNERKDKANQDRAEAISASHHC